MSREDAQDEALEEILERQADALKEALRAQDEALRASWHPDVIVNRAIAQMREALWFHAKGDTSASPGAWFKPLVTDARDEEIIRLKRELRKMTTQTELLREKVARLEALLIDGTQGPTRT